MVWVTGALSALGCGVHGGGEGAVELAGDVPLEASADFAGGFAFYGASCEVGAGFGAVAHSAGGDGVDGAVEGPVAATVEPMSDGAAAAGWQRVGAGEGGEGGVVSASAGMGEADDGLGGADRSDAALVGQARSEIVDDGQKLGAVGLERVTGLAQGQRESSKFGVADGLFAAGIAG